MPRCLALPPSTAVVVQNINHHFSKPLCLPPLCTTPTCNFQTKTLELSISKVSCTTPASPFFSSSTALQGAEGRHDGMNGVHKTSEKHQLYTRCLLNVKNNNNNNWLPVPNGFFGGLLGGWDEGVSHVRDC